MGRREKDSSKCIKRAKESEAEREKEVKVIWTLRVPKE